MADADMVDDLAGYTYSWYNSTLIDMWEEQNRQLWFANFAMIGGCYFQQNTQVAEHWISEKTHCLCGAWY